MEIINNIILFLKDVAAIVVLVLSLAVILVIVRTARFNKAGIRASLDLTPPDEGYGPVEARWNEIRKHIGSFKEAEWKFSIIEADKLVDDILKKIGYKGETMGERLLLITPEQLNSLNLLWQAHKIRNQVVHNVDYKIDHGEARKVLGLYKETLRELQAIK